LALTVNGSQLSILESPIFINVFALKQGIKHSKPVGYEKQKMERILLGFESDFLKNERTKKGQAKCQAF